MSDYCYRPPSILPGSVLDRVTDGTNEDRFDSCVRITDVVWRYGSQSCRTELDFIEWNRLYAEHLAALLAAVTLVLGPSNTSLDREVRDGGMHTKQVEQAQLG